MSPAAYLVALLLCQYVYSTYGFVAGTLPVEPTGSAAQPEQEGCKNRTALYSGDNEDPYHIYHEYCGYLRDSHITYNPPPFRSELTFSESTGKLATEYEELKTLTITTHEQALCHYQIQQLACLTFFPVCRHHASDRDGKTITYGLPCKSTCEQTKAKCSGMLKRGWPMDLDCAKYDYVDDPHSESKQLDSCIDYPTNIASPMSETDPTEPTTDETDPTEPATDETDPTEPATDETDPTEPATDETGSTDGTTKPIEEGSGLECTDYISSCSAKVRTSVSNKAFTNGKFNFAIKGNISEFLKIDGKKALRVKISRDFYLSCEGTQHKAGDEVILKTDADYDSCCLQLSTTENYLLMGHGSPGNWKLRTSNENVKGGSVAAIWSNKYTKIDTNNWLPYCETRVI